MAILNQGRWVAGAMVLALIGASGPASGRQTIAAPMDYSRSESWLCHPDKPGACVAEPATILTASEQAREPVAVHRDPPIDCFYVYPTVSNDPAPSATGRESEAERRAARRQFARLGSVCRLYAPLYRQATLWQMKQSMAGEKISPTIFAEVRALAEADVTAAWAYYLRHDNHGRGFVLIGHSQGSGILQTVIGNAIDGKPVQKQLISAILPGSFVLAPAGKDVGGTFDSIPACRILGQLGCVIVFNAYRSSAPPPTPPSFPNGQKPLCTNPAALAGGAGVLRPYLSTRGETIIPDFTEPVRPLTTRPHPIATPVVTLPDLFWAECRDDDAHGVYLAVEARPTKNDHRTAVLVGDWTVNGVRDPLMGLHLIDLDLTIGNLIDVVRAQSGSYQAKADR
ncbi:DUF3089 domain-containing protein [Caulobacter sp. LARHSG274]